MVVFGAADLAGDFCACVCVCVCVYEWLKRSHFAPSSSAWLGLGGQDLGFGQPTELALLEEKHLWDVGQYTSLADSHPTQQLERERERRGRNLVALNPHEVEVNSHVLFSPCGARRHWQQLVGCVEV